MVADANPQKRRTSRHNSTLHPAHVLQSIAYELIVDDKDRVFSGLCGKSFQKTIKK